MLLTATSLGNSNNLLAKKITILEFRYGNSIRIYPKSKPARDFTPVSTNIFFSLEETIFLVVILEPCSLQLRYGYSISIYLKIRLVCGFHVSSHKICSSLLGGLYFLMGFFGAYCLPPLQSL